MAKYVSESSYNRPSAGLNRINPSVMLVQFKNGNLIPSKKPKLKFACYKKDNNSCARMLVANSKRICYLGSNFESNASKITSSVLKVCVRNKKRCAIELYDADLFHLKPHLKGPKVIDLKNDKTYVEKSSDLTLAFGSKTQQKKINTNMKYGCNAMNSDAVDGILTAMLETSIPGDIATSSNEIKVSAIPPQNSSAINVDEIYNINDIISKEEFEVLDSEAEVFLDLKNTIIQQWKSEKKYPDFIIQFLENNLLSMNICKAKLLCYLNYMFCFLKTNYADWKRKVPIPVSDVPEPFRQKLMESFTINKTMPMRLKDKLLAYTLVLGLKLNNYCINGNIFAASAKIPSKRITSTAYALGCHVSESKTDGIKVIQLKLPLYKFQALPKKRKK